MSGYKLFFNVLDLKDHLNTIKDINKKKTYLEYVLNEFEDLCYHFTDNDIKEYLHKINLYLKPVNTLGLYGLEDNTYISFKNGLSSNLIPFVQKELSKAESLIESLSPSSKVDNDTVDENEVDLLNTELDDNEESAEVPVDIPLIKFRWQKDNVLLPYLFEVLLEEGFISRSDYDDRHKFIEQSFLKKNGKPFTAKESDQTELNYRNNSKTNKKPRNAFKVKRAVEKLKTKEK